MEKYHSSFDESLTAMPDWKTARNYPKKKKKGRLYFILRVKCGLWDPPLSECLQQPQQNKKQLKGSLHYMKSKLNKNNVIYRKIITVLRYEKKLQL